MIDLARLDMLRRAFQRHSEDAAQAWIEHWDPNPAAEDKADMVATGSEWLREVHAAWPEILAMLDSFDENALAAEFRRGFELGEINGQLLAAENAGLREALEAARVEVCKLRSLFEPAEKTEDDWNDLPFVDKLRYRLDRSLADRDQLWRTRADAEAERDAMRAVVEAAVASNPPVKSDPDGLHRKYRVERVDGRDRAGGDKADARYYVLDYAHDPYAGAALLAYAEACRDDLPTLASDLEAAADTVPSLAEVKGRKLDEHLDGRLDDLGWPRNPTQSSNPGEKS